MDIKARIGIRIKSLRKQFNITQEDLANNTGLDRTYINSVENGRRNVSIETLEKISNGFKLNIVEFFDADTFSKEE
ncbi:helix-turn-helix domain-containing protein [Paenibacillus sp. TAF58]